MAAGLSGEPGEAAARLVVVDPKHARALVQVHLLLVVELDVQEVVPSLNHATPMAV